MKIYPLDVAIRQSSQELLASSLGVTQGAIWQAIKHNRNIYIVEDNGARQAVEIKGAFKTKPDLKSLLAVIDVANDSTNQQDIA